MKSTLFAFIAILTIGFFGTASAQPETKLNPGNSLPGGNVTMKNIDGKETTIAGAMDKNGVLVMFSCNTCPFVIKNQPITRQTIAYAKAHHIGVVIINSNQAKRGDDDSYENMKKYAQEQGYTVPYLADDNAKIADMFGANHTPEIFLFNNQQKLVYKGAMNDNPSDPSGYKKMYINDAIDALVAGKKIETPITKSIGCSIKRRA